MNRTRLLWIAVALATAIRLFGGADVAPLATALVAAVIGLAAMVMTSERIVRVAGLFLILIATADLAALFAQRQTAISFDVRSADHLGRDVARMRQQISSTEAALDGDLDRLASQVASVPPSHRVDLFSILRSVIGSTDGRGARIVAARGGPIAWWGEELRTAGGRSYEFDATNVYVIRSRTAGPYALQVFQRISNRPRLTSLPMHLTDAWVDSMIFHGGFLRRDPDLRRFLVERRGDSALFVDIDARSRSEVMDAAAAQGRTASAILLAIGALTVLALLWRSGLKPVWRAVVTVALIATARTALLAIRPINDPLQIFRFDIYGSKILGAFSRSPFDLLLSAAAIVAIVIVLGSLIDRVPIIIRAAFAILAAWGVVELERNLVDNSRISAMPDHILATSAAQALLLGAVMLFALSVLRLVRHEESRLRAGVAVAALLIPVLLLAYYLWPGTGAAFLCAGLTVLLAILAWPFARRGWMALFVTALLVVPIAFGP
ncbi:MAG: hypothetical protein ACXVIJ_04590, partial [Thermoanaerobaculia bacterium]